MSSSNLPLATNSKGHYRTSSLMTLPNTLAAGARLFTIRNTGTNLLVPTRLTLRAVQAAAGTAQLAIIAAYRLTSFTVSDTTNASSLVSVVVSNQAGYMAAAPGNAELFVNAAATAGMTGGTLTRDSQPFSVLPVSLTAAANTTLWQLEALDGAAAGAHPFVLKQNEGIDVENVGLNVTSYGLTLVIDFAWAEVGNFGQ